MGAVAKSISNDSIRDYLKEIGRIPLLTQEQEIVLAKQIKEAELLTQKTLDSLELTLKRAPSAEELDNALAKLERSEAIIVKRGNRAKEKFIAANLRLVVSVAKKYSSRGLDFMDLVQEGSIGLNRAVEKFDYTRGYKFSTYAYWWIRQALTRAIATQARTIRLPVHVTEKLNKLKKANRELSVELRRTPKKEELAARLQWAVEDIDKICEAGRSPVSLSIMVGESADTELGTLLVDPSQDPGAVTEADESRERLYDALARLTDKEREVITLRFGLDDGVPLSLAAIGNLRGISRERVRQIEAKALIKLRAPSARRLLKNLI